MRHYELTYLISKELNEEEVQNLQNKIISLIESAGGVLINQKAPIKKKLAYPVKKQPVAYLATIIYQLSAEKLTDLEKKLKTEAAILRYLIVVLPSLTQPSKPTLPLTPIKKPAPTKKTKLEEIEKKLDEILDVT